jgi:hypothetical protein
MQSETAGFAALTTDLSITNAALGSLKLRINQTFTEHRGMHSGDFRDQVP